MTGPFGAGDTTLDSAKTALRAEQENDSGYMSERNIN